MHLYSAFARHPQRSIPKTASPSLKVFTFAPTRSICPATTMPSTSLLGRWYPMISRAMNRMNGLTARPRTRQSL